MKLETDEQREGRRGGGRGETACARERTRPRGGNEALL